MKRIALIAALAAFLATNAGAIQLGGDTNNYGGQGGDATAIAGAAAGAIAAQGQANEQTVGYTEADPRNTYEEYTPSAVAPSINPTAPCYVPVSVGGGAPGISFSGGTAYEDKACTQRELIRMGLQSGQPSAASKATSLLNGMLDEALAAASKAEVASTDAGISGYSDLTGF